MSENRSESLVVRAEPMDLAKQGCWSLVEEVRKADSALMLAADPMTDVMSNPRHASLQAIKARL